MSIQICADCGKKYVERENEICDSCKDIRATINEITGADILKDEQEIISKEEVEYEYGRRERQERQQLESGLL